MVDLDTLACMDGLVWLRSGREVAHRLNLDQSSVSRRQQRCASSFGVTLKKKEQEWVIQGDRTLLNMERRVHQAARLQGLRPLRLEASYWTLPLLCDPEPSGWIAGLSNLVGVEPNLTSLRERICDAWICGLPEQPDLEDPDLCILPLCTMPLQLLVRADHPLVNKQSLSIEDLQAFPSLALPNGVYPTTEKQLRAIGLWNSPVRMTRYRKELWEGRSATDVTIGYGHCLSQAACNESLVSLPFELPFASGEVLVVQREQHQHPTIQALAHDLRTRLEALQELYPEIRLTPLARADV